VRDKVITSLQNPTLKWALRLRESRFRKQEKRVLVEGAREIQRALSSGWQLETFFYCEDSLSLLAQEVLKTAVHGQRLSLSAPLYSKLCLRESSDGLCGIFHEKCVELSQLVPSKTSLILAVEGIEKPGNLGALLRTCDAVGAAALVLLGSCLDSLGANVIRSSLGARFTVPVIATTPEIFCTYVKTHDFTQFAAVLAENTRVYHEVVYPKRTVLLLGSEAHGLQPWWQDKNIQGIQIPMCGKIDSLNVSVAAGILLYEVHRQLRVI
jgi:TrmH family RNA methyltransferase